MGHVTLGDVVEALIIAALAQVQGVLEVLKQFCFEPVLPLTRAPLGGGGRILPLPDFLKSSKKVVDIDTMITVPNLTLNLTSSSKQEKAVFF